MINNVQLIYNLKNPILFNNSTNKVIINFSYQAYCSSLWKKCVHSGGKSMMNEDVRAEKHIEEKENETQDIIKRAFQIGQKSVIKSGKKNFEREW